MLITRLAIDRNQSKMKANAKRSWQPVRARGEKQGMGQEYSIPNWVHLALFVSIMIYKGASDKYYIIYVHYILQLRLT